MAEREGLVAELWYASAPDLGDPLLLEGLRAVSPGTEAQDGSLVWARIHPQDRDRIRAIVSSQDEGEEGCDLLEYRERHRDYGSVVHAYERGELTDDRITDPVRAYFEALQWSTRMVRSTRP